MYFNLSKYCVDFLHPSIFLIYCGFSCCLSVWHIQPKKLLIFHAACRFENSAFGETPQNNRNSSSTGFYPQFCERLFPVKKTFVPNWRRIRRVFQMKVIFVKAMSETNSLLSFCSVQQTLSEFGNKSVQSVESWKRKGKSFCELNFQLSLRLKINKFQKCQMWKKKF